MMFEDLADRLIERIHKTPKRSFIEMIDPERAENPALKRQYKRIGASRGSIANVHKVQSLNPNAMKAHLDLYMSIVYREDSDLNRRERELVATAVSFLNSCMYCITHHYEALQAHWTDAPPIEEIFRDPVTSGLTDRELSILTYTIKLTEEPFNITEEDVSHLKDSGLSDKAILDLVLVVSYFNFVNRLVLGTGVPLEEDSEREYKY